MSSESQVACLTALWFHSLRPVGAAARRDVKIMAVPLLHAACSVPVAAFLQVICLQLAPRAIRSSAINPHPPASQVPRSLRLTFDEDPTPEELARLARKGRKGLVAAMLRQEGAAAEQKRKQKVGCSEF